MAFAFRVPPSEIERWSDADLAACAAYCQFVPLPDVGTQTLMAQIAAMTANVHRDPKKGAPVRLPDVAPWLGPKVFAPPESPEDRAKRLFAVIGSMGRGR